MPQSIIERHLHPKYPRLQLQLRAKSKYWQAWTSLDGRKRMKSTETTALTTAFRIAEDWYRKELRASVDFGRQHPIAKMTHDPVLKEIFASYKDSLPAAKKPHADHRWGPIEQFWRAVLLSDVGPGKFKEFYAWRRRTTKGIKPHTLHKDVILVRQILKHAMEDELIERLPIIPSPGTITPNPRPWLTKAEWKRLHDLAVERIGTATNVRTAQQRTDLLHMMIFMVSTCVRVDEMLAIRFDDCREEKTKDGTEILIAEVTGKRGTRTIVGPNEALTIIELRRKGKKASDLVFPEHHRDAFQELLKAAKLYTDKRGFTRNMKSLRATAISFRVLNGDDLLLIARNAGTSVAMIDQFYARRLSAEMGREILGESVSMLG